MSQLSKLEKAHPSVFHMLGFVIRELALGVGVSPATKAIIHETADILESVPVITTEHIQETVATHVSEAVAALPVPTMPTVEEIAAAVPAPVIDHNSEAFKSAVAEEVQRQIAAYFTAQAKADPNAKTEGP